MLKTSLELIFLFKSGSNGGVVRWPGFADTQKTLLSVNFGNKSRTQANTQWHKAYVSSITREKKRNTNKTKRLPKPETLGLKQTFCQINTKRRTRQKNQTNKENNNLIATLLHDSSSTV